ncbi:MAG TPA: FtsX-like permease family protein [Acidobacteriota bacterium]|nr:FtsX-like permease family protein [Acidobacteriota bacterium]
MELRLLVFRNVVYYWRTNLAVIAGVAAAVSVLSGALLVGSSVRGSLRSLVYQRLGKTDFVISSDHFFRARLLGDAIGAGANATGGCPIIYLQGVVIYEKTGAHAYDVNVYGVDERFWKLQDVAVQGESEPRSALVGDALAESLGLQTGEDLLLKIDTRQGIPRESLFGRKENAARTMRLVCGGILPAGKLGRFALRPDQGTVYSIFVPLRLLQRGLSQPMRANTFLLTAKEPGDNLQNIRGLLRERYSLPDVGIKLRPLESRMGIAVESTRVLLGESIVRAAFETATDAGMKASGILTYLANSIRAGGREIPYSVITAADLGREALASIQTIKGLTGDHTGDGGEAIWLNEWAWRDLGITPGERVDVDYYLWQDEGRLLTRTAQFRFAGVIPIGGEVDASLTPEIPGITETRSISSWDPPFPLDLHRIRAIDEEYWKRYGSTPKAFIRLERGQELWQSRFGNLTAVRIALREGMDLTSALTLFEAGLRKRLDPERDGFTLSAVREQGLNASRGSTDFGEYFVYFSLFLVVASLLLSGLFFRLGIEQRAREIGSLLAMGFPVRTIREVFLLEGGLLSAGGCLLGLVGAVGYGGLLVLALRNWWIGAVGTRYLYLHVTRADLALGACAGLAASLVTITWTLHCLQHNSPRTLLAGVLESSSIRMRRARMLVVVAAVALVAAAFILVSSALKVIPEVAGFFAAGIMLLISILGGTAVWLRRAHPSMTSAGGWQAYLDLGIRNAMHRPGRSLSCIALISAATFVIVSVEAFRQDPRNATLDPASGTGGFPLLAKSTLPIVVDPNSADGREALGIPVSEVPEFAEIRFVPFRVRPGDDASCLNLYAPQEPKILGALHPFLAAGRFSFQESLASTPEQKRNPWLLLESNSEDGIIPAVGDANTIQYILHLSVGGELAVRKGDGTYARLRLVGSLRNSILQGELVVSEANFLRAFPEQEGYRFFLLDVNHAAGTSLAQPLMQRLENWGFSVESSQERLSAYQRVENTYLSTFQSLGGLGLILGTVGLAAVLLRNVLERRKELALLRAVGYRRQILSAIIVSENLVLLICGLAGGTVCALLATLPALLARGHPFPAGMVSIILLAVLFVGLSSSILAVLAAIRSPLLGALKSE